MQKQLIQAIKAGPEPLDDELFLAIFEIEDTIEQQKFIEAARAKCREVKRLREFNNLLNVWKEKNAQNKRQQGSNKTRFTDGPLVLNCGDWIANDTGVYKNEINGRGIPYKITACPHPILPVERLVNIEDGIERVRLMFFKDKKWQSITVTNSTISNKQKIIELADRGVMVTSETAKNLVAYLQDVKSLNMADTEEGKAIPLYRSINRLGWVENDFVPYQEDIRYDGDKSYESLYGYVTQVGDKEKWFALAKEVRENLIVRLLLDASLASVLIERVGALPFVFHLWGTTSFGKTVSLMVAMSVWGNPEIGCLTRSMDATIVGLVRSAAFLYNLPYGADEMQQIKNKWMDHDTLIMKITEGQDRTRGTKDGVETLKRWRNCFIFTGEEPITSERSGGGAKNRVIEIEVEEQLYKSGFEVANTVRENYGWAGKEFVDNVREMSNDDLKNRYKVYMDLILNECDTTDKQALSMALILLADELSCKSIFSEEKPLSVDDIKPYLSSARKVDTSERAYSITSGWVTSNQNEFAIEELDGKCIMPNGKVHGKISNNKEFVDILKTDLQNFLQENGFSYDAVIGKWREKGYIDVFKNGKSQKPINTHNVSIGAIKKTSCVRLRLSSESTGKVNDWIEESEQTQLF